VKAAKKTLAELGEDVILAPERHVALADAGEGVPLASIVVERNERAVPSEHARTIVLDTTHARDGILDLAAAMRAPEPAKSAKKLARPGDLLVSRLRPYLRQIALVRTLPPRHVLCVSTEFYVLAPRENGDDLAWLLPFLLSDRTQQILAAAQEGGHHPRVPRSSLFAIRVPQSMYRARKARSRTVSQALDALYVATDRYRAAL
jgi:hypothetical protein